MLASLLTPTTTTNHVPAAITWLVQQVWAEHLLQAKPCWLLVPREGAACPLCLPASLPSLALFRGLPSSSLRSAALQAAIL